MNAVTLHVGDCRAVLQTIAEDSVDSVLTDPPYFLESIHKRFGKANAAKPKGGDGRFRRLSGGFMGQAWDAADDEGYRVTHDVLMWKEVFRVLKPGGFLLAFASPRTGHRMACAIEDAGFIMHPFFGWVYGQGFPKAHSVSKAIDKAAGAERPVVDIDSVVRRRMRPGVENNESGSWDKSDERNFSRVQTAPGTQEAAEWEGWFYGAQTAKPALEPVYLAQKPYSERTGYLNVLKHGTGAFNIDACRVSAAEGELGRWPANLLHDGSQEVVGMFPDAPGQQGKAGSRNPKTKAVYGSYANNESLHPEPRGDAGSAGRFFNEFPFEVEPVRYCQKAGKNDRAGSKHPTVKPIALLAWFCRLVTPPGGVILDPFAGSGTTAAAATKEGFSAILIEKSEEYAADIRRRFDLPQFQKSRRLADLLDEPVPDRRSLQELL